MEASGEIRAAFIKSPVPKVPDSDLSTKGSVNAVVSSVPVGGGVSISSSPFPAISPTNVCCSPSATASSSQPPTSGAKSTVSFSRVLFSVQNPFSLAQFTGATSPPQQADNSQSNFTVASSTQGSMSSATVIAATTPISNSSGSVVAAAAATGSQFFPLIFAAPVASSSGCPINQPPPIQLQIGDSATTTTTTTTCTTSSAPPSSSILPPVAPSLIFPLDTTTVTSNNQSRTHNTTLASPLTTPTLVSGPQCGTSASVMNRSQSCAATTLPTVGLTGSSATPLASVVLAPSTGAVTGGAGLQHHHVPPVFTFKFANPNHFQCVATTIPANTSSTAPVSVSNPLLVEAPLLPITTSTAAMPCTATVGGSGSLLVSSSSSPSTAVAATLPVSPTPPRFLLHKPLSSSSNNNTPMMSYVEPSYPLTLVSTAVRQSVDDLPAPTSSSTTSHATNAAAQFSNATFLVHDQSKVSKPVAPVAASTNLRLIAAPVTAATIKCTTLPSVGVINHHQHAASNLVSTLKTINATGHHLPANQQWSVLTGAHAPGTLLSPQPPTTSSTPSTPHAILLHNDLVTTPPNTASSGEVLPYTNTITTTTTTAIRAVAPAACSHLTLNSVVPGSLSTVFTFNLTNTTVTSTATPVGVSSVPGGILSPGRPLNPLSCAAVTAPLVIRLPTQTGPPTFTRHRQHSSSGTGNSIATIATASLLPQPSRKRARKQQLASTLAGPAVLVNSLSSTISGNNTNLTAVVGSVVSPPPPSQLTVGNSGAIRVCPNVVMTTPSAAGVVATATTTATGSNKPPATSMVQHPPTMLAPTTPTLSPTFIPGSKLTLISTTDPSLKNLVTSASAPSINATGGLLGIRLLSVRGTSVVTSNPSITLTAVTPRGLPTDSATATVAAPPYVMVTPSATSGRPLAPATTTTTTTTNDLSQAALYVLTSSSAFPVLTNSCSGSSAVLSTAVAPVVTPTTTTTAAVATMMVPNGPPAANVLQPRFRPVVPSNTTTQTGTNNSSSNLESVLSGQLASVAASPMGVCSVTTSDGTMVGSGSPVICSSSTATVITTPHKVKYPTDYSLDGSSCHNTSLRASLSSSSSSNPLLHRHLLSPTAASVTPTFVRKEDPTTTADNAAETMRSFGNRFIVSHDRRHRLPAAATATVRQSMDTSHLGDTGSEGQQATNVVPRKRARLEGVLVADSARSGGAPSTAEDGRPRSTADAEESVISGRPPRPRIISKQALATARNVAACRTKESHFLSLSEIVIKQDRSGDLRATNPSRRDPQTGRARFAAAAAARRRSRRRLPPTTVDAESASSADDRALLRDLLLSRRLQRTEVVRNPTSSMLDIKAGRVVRCRNNFTHVNHMESDALRRLQAIYDDLKLGDSPPAPPHSASPPPPPPPTVAPTPRRVTRSAGQLATTTPQLQPVAGRSNPPLWPTNNRRQATPSSLLRPRNTTSHWTSSFEAELQSKLAKARDLMKGLQHRRNRILTSSEQCEFWLKALVEGYGEIAEKCLDVVEQGPTMISSRLSTLFASFTCPKGDSGEVAATAAAVLSAESNSGPQLRRSTRNNCSSPTISVGDLKRAARFRDVAGSSVASPLASGSKSSVASGRSTGLLLRTTADETARQNHADAVVQPHGGHR